MPQQLPQLLASRGTTMLTASDQELLSILSLCAQVASLSQAARICGLPSESASIFSRLQRLEKIDFIGHTKSVEVEMPPLLEPLVNWQPGQWVPDFGPVVWQLQKRWHVPRRPLHLFFVTPRAARLFGGRRKGRPSRLGQISHDLGVTEMFLSVKWRHPELVEYWVDEARLAAFRRGQKLPDAMLAKTPSATPIRVLEFGGHYGKKRLQAFHHDCERRGSPYEIW
ncbi:MAG TPA: hypothetical protein VGN12_20735 [Pirellulales bacterium]